MYKKFIDFVRDTYQTKEFIPLHEPRFVGNEKAYINECIDSTFVSSVGKFVNQFEEKIAEYTSAKYAIACVNGTSALHIALQLAGVQQGDLVITQPLTFIATCNAIKYLNADPAFIDVDDKNLGMSPEKLEVFLSSETELKGDTCYHKSTGKRIAAIMPMHTFGLPCKIDKIAEIANHYHIPLVEDSAESIGSTYNNQHTGTFGLVSAYSFNGNKTITCGGGGIILTNDETLAKKGKHLTTQAKTPHRWEYNHDMIGYNYRMPNLNAALAVAQLEQLEAFITNKRKLNQHYQDFFKGEDIGIKLIQEENNTRSNYWLNAILLPDYKSRNNFLEQTNTDGVMTRPSWTLMNKLPLFEKCITGNLDNALDIEQRLVNIPSSVVLPL